MSALDLFSVISRMCLYIKNAKSRGERIDNSKRLYSWVDEEQKAMTKGWIGILYAGKLKIEPSTVALSFLLIFDFRGCYECGSRSANANQ